eukprot:TRINITY_DN6937_c0_g1_i1.p1 TRINITY_DN6937_c0_g1~~TRINITY_DN6937_c0_g1_i1.p1  ORF type:complete len:349 (+),score=67.64 TRINITY_DN6937_c0_g1_i1:60-1106(+)
MSVEKDQKNQENEDENTTPLPKMQYVRLGSTGTKVSRICLGMMTYGDPNWRDWVLKEEPSIPIIKKAHEYGINFFDTADAYSRGVSEQILGNVWPSLARREDLVIATKVFNPMSDNVNDRGLSRKHIMESIENSLKRLNTTYVDLYQIHRWDYDTPIEETLEALHDLVRSGKVHYIGASSMAAWQFGKALAVSKYRGITPFVTMQNHYNLIYREEEREMIPLCKSEGIGLLPWSPLARGFLCRPLDEKTLRAETDPYSKICYFKPETKNNDAEIVNRVLSLAEKKKLRPAQVALSWMLHKPHVTSPIIGASKMYQLEDAVRALDVKLSGDEIKYLEEVYLPHSVAGHQ